MQIVVILVDDAAVSGHTEEKTDGVECDIAAGSDVLQVAEAPVWYCGANNRERGGCSIRGSVTLQIRGTQQRQSGQSPMHADYFPNRVLLQP